jgi:hypothetical protein
MQLNHIIYNDDPPLFCKLTSCTWPIFTCTKPKESWTKGTPNTLSQLYKQHYNYKWMHQCTIKNQMLGPGSTINGTKIPSQNSHNEYQSALRVIKPTFNHINYMFWIKCSPITISSSRQLTISVIWITHIIP